MIRYMVKIEDWSEKEISEACSFTLLLDRVYEKIQSVEGGGQYAFSKCVKSRADFEPWQQSFRKELLKSLGIKDFLEARKEVVLVRGNSKLHWSENKYTIEHFYLKSWMDTLVPILICIPKTLPKGGKFPAMICAHGHLMQKENLVGKKQNLIYRQSWAKDFAEMGCITASMDQWGFGERGKSFWYIFKRKHNYDVYERKYAQNMLGFGQTITGLRVFDSIRIIDYLRTREDADPNRIGISGLSMGGLTASLVAALEDRISMAVIAGFLNTFKSSIIDLPQKHCADMIIPGILQLSEEFDFLSLIAPRPLCFIAGIKDQLFPIKGATHAFDEIKKAYQLLGATDNCVLDMAPMGHGWRGNIAYTFVKEKWFL
jgi:Abhydrolase family